LEGKETKQKPVSVSADWADQQLHYPCDRAIHHQTLVCCIFASSESCCCLVLFANRGVLVILDHEVRENIDLQISIINSPYMMGDIFIEYTCSVLTPAMETDWSLPGRLNKPAILFCDSSSCHCSDDVMKELAIHRILLITCPLHPSRIF
jgi:hypothetical protein